MERMVREEGPAALMEYCIKHPNAMQDGCEILQWEIDNRYHSGNRIRDEGEVLLFIAMMSEEPGLGRWACRELAELGERKKIGLVADKAASPEVSQYARDFSAYGQRT